MQRQDRPRLDPGAILAPLAAALLTAGCGGEGAGTAAVPVTTDSAGVHIVVNQVPATGSSLFATVAPSPTIVQAGGGPGVEVSGAVTLPDGRIAVADAGSREVRFHDAGGGLIASVEGEGPGRFQSVSRIGHVAGDTLWVADHRGGQLALVTPRGEAGRYAFPQGLTVAGRFADDGYLMVPQWSPTLLEADWVEGVRRDSASWGLW